MNTINNNFFMNNTQNFNNKSVSDSNKNSENSDFNCLLNNKQKDKKDNEITQTNIPIANIMSQIILNNEPCITNKKNMNIPNLISDDNKINLKMINNLGDMATVSENSLTNNNIKTENILSNIDGLEDKVSTINKDNVENADLKNINGNLLKYDSLTEENESFTINYENMLEQDDLKQGISENKMGVFDIKDKDELYFKTDFNKQGDEIIKDLSTNSHENIQIDNNLKINDNIEIKSKDNVHKNHLPTVSVENQQSTIEEISKYIQKSIQNNSKEIEIQLNPQHLGKIIIKASTDSANTEVSITCFTEHAKDIITKCANDIGAILQNRIGGETTVYVDTKSDNIFNPNQQDDNKNQQNNQNHNQSKKRNSNNVDLDFIEQLRLGIS